MKLLFLLLVTSISLFAQGKKEIDNIFYKGYEAYDKGRFEESLKELNKVIKKNPAYKGAYNLRGLAYLNLYELDSAIADFTSAISIDTNNADAYNNRGLARMNLEMVDSAFYDFNKAIEKDPKFAEAYINRGSANFAAGFTERALEDFNNAEKYNSKNPELYSQRAKLYAYIKQYDNEMKDIEKAIKFGMTNADTYFRLGNSYYRKEQYDQAIKNYNKSLSMDSSFYNSLNNRAMAYDLSGKPELAAKDRQKLNAVSGNIFVHPDSLKAVVYTSPDSSFSVELPDNWIIKDTVTGDYTLAMLSLEKFDSEPDPLLPSIQFSYNRNMKKNHNVESAAEIIEFWKETVKTNAAELYRYDLFTQKHMSKNGFMCILNNAMLQYVKMTPPMITYELAMADEDLLFFVYLSAPSTQWEYFKPIFERIVDNLQVRKLH